MAHPIWKDYIITIADLSSVDFWVELNGNRIYNGRAYRKPNAETIEIKINDICANYFANTLPSNFPNNGAQNENYILEFALKYVDTNTETIITQQVEFYNDWSFNQNRVLYINSLLTAPILRIVPRGATVIASAIGNLSINNLTFEGGISEVTNAMYIANEGDSVTISAINSGDITYKVVDNCYRYILYYLNAMGGWDFLLIEGKDKQTDNYTRHTIGQAYNNDNTRNRGTRNYRNDIVRKWELHTLWIDDAGAQNMHHLLGSTDVYLYDMQTEQLHPVTIANTSCEYKTYSNNGNQLIRYDIEATLARNIIRR